MKKKEIYRIIKEELRLALEGCGYTHTVKGKKLKTSGGTGDKDIKKETTHKAKDQNFGGKAWQAFRNSLKGLSTSTKLQKLAASSFSDKLKDNYRNALRRGGQLTAKENAGTELGFKYMNKYNTAPSDTVGTINADDEDPSDEHSQKSENIMKLTDLLNEGMPKRFTVTDKFSVQGTVFTKGDYAFKKKWMGKNMYLNMDNNSMVAIDSQDYAANKRNIKEGKINESEGYVEIMDMSLYSDTGKNIKNTLLPFVKTWNKWKSGPATERNMHKPAKKDLINYITSFLEKNIR